MDENTLNQTDQTMVSDDNKPIEEPIVDEGSKQTEKTFTQEEVNQIIKKRLEKEKAKYREELEAERNEAERLAKLSASDREKEMLRLEREKFEQEKEQFAKERLLMETNKQLMDRNLPIDFAEYLISDSAETTLDNINKFESTWSGALKNAVDAKIVGSSPKVPEHANKSSISMDEIKNMSTEDIIKNYDSVMNALKNK